MPKLRRTRSLVLPPLRLPIDHHLVVAQARHAAGHGLVVAKGAIPVNLAEIREDPLDKVHGIGPLGMPRPLDSDPRRRNRLRLVGIPCFLFAHRYLSAAPGSVAVGPLVILRVAGGWDKFRGAVPPGLSRYSWIFQSAFSRRCFRLLRRWLLGCCLLRFDRLEFASWLNRLGHIRRAGGPSSASMR